ncbi:MULTISPECIES: winged helix-turn-helix domain-containing protein [Haloferax]|nr:MULTISPECIES: winged helix-turn-helix domain-containing protein [Haloferax]
MVAPDHSDVFDVLRSRAEILVALSGEGKSPADLSADLSVSRSTIDRGLHELERAEFVEVADSVATLTLSGRLALETYTTLVEELDEIGSVAGALESLPSEIAVDPVMVRGGSAVVAASPDDERPLDQLRSFIEGATSIRGCVRESAEAQVELYYQRVVEDDVSVSLVATADVVGRLIGTRRPQLAELLGTDSFTLRTTDTLPYSLFVFELPRRSVAVLALYDAGRLAGVVSSDSPDAVAWAHDQLDRWWNESDSLPLSTDAETDTDTAAETDADAAADE